jgi:hypothetical protein
MILQRGSVDVFLGHIGSKTDHGAHWISAG